jgi:capsular polysaccharide biosynthesis protein
MEVWRRLALVVLIAYAVTAVGLMQPPIYEASVKLLVDWRQGQWWENSSGSGEEMQTLEVRGDPPTETIMYAIETPGVAREVIQRLNLQTEPGELLGNLSVEPVENTTFISVSYEDASPRRAKRIVNSVSAVTSKLVSDRSNEVSLVVWERAKDTTDPVSRPYRNGLVTLVVGLVLAAVLTHGVPRSLAAGVEQIADGLVESLKFQTDQLLTRVRQGVAQARPGGGRRAALREAEAVKEKELLRALGRHGKLSAVEAALETSLSVDDCNRILLDLANRGQLEMNVERGRVVYAFWEGGK